jgi:hypothetical protein
VQQLLEACQSWMLGNDGLCAWQLEVQLGCNMLLKCVDDEAAANTWLAHAVDTWRVPAPSGWTRPATDAAAMVAAAAAAGSGEVTSGSGSGAAAATAGGGGGGAAAASAAPSPYQPPPRPQDAAALAAEARATKGAATAAGASGAAGANSAAGPSGGGGGGGDGGGDGCVAGARRAAKAVAASEPTAVSSGSGGKRPAGAAAAPGAKVRKTPCCSKCGQPRKGHVCSFAATSPDAPAEAAPVRPGGPTPVTTEPSASRPRPGSASAVRDFSKPGFFTDFWDSDNEDEEAAEQLGPSCAAGAARNDPIVLDSQQTIHDSDDDDNDHDDMLPPAAAAASDPPPSGAPALPPAPAPSLVPAPAAWAPAKQMPPPLPLQPMEDSEPLYRNLDAGVEEFEDAGGDDGFGGGDFGGFSQQEEPQPGETQDYGREADDTSINATQSYGNESEAVLFRMEQGQAVGVAAVLPAQTDVLIFCRVDAPTKEPAGHIVELVDARPVGQKQVSHQQAEISWINGKLNLVSLGKTYNHVNGMPLHSDPKTHRRSCVQIYNGDEIRLGGNVDGQKGGGFSDFIFLVNAPALGDRPLPRPAAAAPPRASANEAEAERKRRRQSDRKQQERVAQEERASAEVEAKAAAKAKASAEAKAKARTKARAEAKVRAEAEAKAGVEAEERAPAEQEAAAAEAAAEAAAAAAAAAAAQAAAAQAAAAQAAAAQAAAAAVATAAPPSLVLRQVAQPDVPLPDVVLTPGATVQLGRRMHGLPNTSAFKTMSNVQCTVTMGAAAPWRVMVARVGSASTRVGTDGVEKGEARECRLDDAIVIGGKAADKVLVTYTLVHN